MSMVNFTGEFYIAGEFVYDSSMNNNVGKLCTEFAPVKIITLREYIESATLRDDWKETYDEVMNKYPEYFI